MVPTLQTRLDRADGGGRSERTRPAIEREIVDVLDRSETMDSPSARDLLVGQIQDEISVALAVRNQAVARLHLADIVRACSHTAGGLPALAVVFAHLTRDAPEAQEILRLVDEWQGMELFSDADLSAVSSGCLETLTIRQVAGAYRAATQQRRSEVPRHCRNGFELFNHLAGLAASSDGVPPALRFLRLVLDLLPPPERGAVEAFTERWAGGWGLEITVDRLDSPDESTPAFLIIRIMPTPDGQYLVSHWRQGPSRQWRPERQRDVEATRHRLEPIVEKLVDEAEAAWADAASSAQLRFILPFDLLDEPVEAWERESSPKSSTGLIFDYPVTISSLERIQARHWHRAWRNRWKTLTERPASTKVYTADPADGARAASVERDLKLVPEYVAMVLSEAPRAGGVGEEELLAGLSAGLPVIIWHRLDCGDPDFRAAAEHLLGAGADLRLVPDRARQWMLRSMSFTAGDGEPGDGGAEPSDAGSSAAWKMAVIFDDPTRQVDRPEQRMAR